MEEKENITKWLHGNRDNIIKGNKMLTEQQIEKFSNELNKLNVQNEETDTDKKAIIDAGNLVLKEMNDIISAKIESEISSIEAFLNIMHGEKQKGSTMFIMKMFDTMLDLHKYDMVIEYFVAVDLNKVQDTGNFISLVHGTNPISPLLRPIPKKDNVEDFLVKRYAFFEKCKEHLIAKDDESTAQLLRVLKPENYDSKVKEFDMLYINGAPKEK